MDNKFSDSLNFVVRYYRAGRFVPRRRFVWYWDIWRRRGVAASLAGCVLCASAAVAIYMQHSAPERIPQTSVSDNAVAGTPELVTKRLEFADTRLDSAVVRIEQVYGVRVAGVGVNDSIRVTLSYDGDAQGLVDMLNATFGTGLRLKSESLTE